MVVRTYKGTSWIEYPYTPEELAAGEKAIYGNVVTATSHRPGPPHEETKAEEWIRTRRKGRRNRKTYKLKRMGDG